ncbi:MAG: polyprenyl synthetase family protein [Burkholderiales bacterium]|nr:polyprenyl synthetase family protein [Burkholderiales bacterium]MCA3226748.1 polyprenyl synthetase family protein [Burkholderiales bacterium]MCE2644107.1 polyprenyl synthetase family protein [Burkholderiaceae bacterium]
MAARLAAFEVAATAQLPAADRAPQRLHQAMRYAVLDGGKRVRPLLVDAAGEVVGAPEPALRAAALAVEYVHAYSLIHDDLPCMDNDVLRRGKPTVHIAFDEATAMLAGDALQAEAFQAIAEAPIEAGTRAALMAELAAAAGTRGMCGGQAIDLAAVGSSMSRAELEQMHGMKTGALLRAAVRMGALAGAADPAVLAPLDRYAHAVGLAFQVVDDVLDVEATSQDLGKTAGKDAQQGKPTYVSMLGLSAARQWAERLRQDAHGALDTLPAAAAARAVRLRQLADFIVLRKS